MELGEADGDPPRCLVYTGALARGSPLHPLPAFKPQQVPCPPCPPGGQGADTGSWQGSRVGLSIRKKDAEAG